MKNITIYSTPTCSYCNMAKDFLTKNNIPFTAIDVASDTAKREEMIEISGQMGVPVIMVDDEFVVGFDKVRLSELLDIKE